MTWDLPFWLSVLWTTTVALTAAVAYAAVKLRTDALSVRLAECYTKLSEIEASARSTSSSLVESAELRDAIEKGNELLKRVNQREIMRARRTQAIDPGATKDDLRRYAGLTAGKPAPHR